MWWSCIVEPRVNGHRRCSFPSSYDGLSLGMGIRAVVPLVKGRVAFNRGQRPHGREEPTSELIHAFVTKVDAYGSTIFAALLGGESNDSGRGIAVDASGNIVVVG